MQLSLGPLTAHYLFGCDEHVGPTIQDSINAFLTLSEAFPTRWIESAKGAMLLQMVPGDPASGAIYVLDRKYGLWFLLCFDDAADDQFTSEKFDKVFSEYDLFQYVDQPQ